MAKLHVPKKSKKAAPGSTGPTPGSTPGTSTGTDLPDAPPGNAKKPAIPADAIHYRIVPADLAGHVFAVTLTLAQPAAGGQVFQLPAWIPGSYMLREFARHIVQISAEADGRAVALVKLDKHSWQAAPCSGPLTLQYQVYAWDLSVRAAHLDQNHGFYNGSSVFLRVLGQEQQPHVVEIVCPEAPHCQTWRVATALPELEAVRYGFGTYIAGDYDELIDHPVEMGTFALATFNAHGVPHDVVITGRVPHLDMARLCADLKKICEAQIVLFEPETRLAPMARYVFMTLALGEGYGGLEHRASTALICARADLPVLSARMPQAEMSDGYRTYLGLCSHEYFHTWNVKRIKPALFVPYALQTETYTTLLWLFEGFTSYYDDLMLLRSQVIDSPAYLKLLGNTINSVLRGSGRFKQSVAESSFDAWVKYYRQDENAPNAMVSYYTKGALVALALDLTIRSQTEGANSLDDVMRALWQRFGRDFYSPGAQPSGLDEAQVLALFEDAVGIRLKRFFDRYIYGTEDLPLAKLLAPFGITLQNPRVLNQVGIEARIEARNTRDGSDCKLANVYENGAAHRAGLSAGDVLVALDGLRVSMNGATSLDKLLARYQAGDVVEVHAFRRDELMVFAVTLEPDAAPQVKLTVPEKPVPASRIRAGWLQKSGL